MKRQRPPVRRQTYLIVYGLLALFMLLSHGPILDTPFFWDETGQFIPAALDIFHGDLVHAGSLIPHSTVPNVHPPGVMVFLAAFWKLFGFTIRGTRVAMLLVGAFGALMTFLLAIELGRDAPGVPAFSALALFCVSPLFFSQAMLAQLDMPAMALTLLALLLFLQDRFRDSALVCVALVLTKETGLAAPAVFAAYLLLEKRPRQAAWFTAPAVALAIWILALRFGTGHWFGNAEFTSYNVFYPLHPARLLIALLRRIYYLFIGTGHFIGTAALIWAIRRMAIFRTRPWRITATLVAVHVLAVSVLGGAVLERYLLPVLPIILIAFALSFQALVPRPRRIATAALMICLIAANFLKPLYSFPFENNLAFLSFIDLEREAAGEISLRKGTIATTFPLSAALRHPEYGYTEIPRDVAELKTFRRAELAALADHRPDMLVIYDTAWDPLHLLSRSPTAWIMKSFLNYEAPLTTDQAAKLLSMRIVRRMHYGGLEMSLLIRAPKDIDEIPGVTWHF